MKWTYFLFLLLIGCSQQTPSSALPFYQDGTLTPQWIRPDRSDIHTIADFSLLNQDGAKITQAAVDGKIYVAHFFFSTCPSVCPNSITNLKKIQRAFQGDGQVLLLSHTVQPQADSVEVLQRYAKERAISGDQWHLLTGERKMLYDLARHSYFAAAETPSEDDFLHTEKLILVDGKRRIRGVYNATVSRDMKRVIEDIQTLKQEG